MFLKTRTFPPVSELSLSAYRLLHTFILSFSFLPIVIRKGSIEARHKASSPAFVLLLLGKSPFSIPSVRKGNSSSLPSLILAGTRGSVHNFYLFQELCSEVSWRYSTKQRYAFQVSFRYQSAGRQLIEVRGWLPTETRVSPPHGLKVKRLRLICPPT